MLVQGSVKYYKLVYIWIYSTGVCLASYPNLQDNNKGLCKSWQLNAVCQHTVLLDFLLNEFNYMNYPMQLGY